MGAEPLADAADTVFVVGRRPGSWLPYMLAAIYDADLSAAVVTTRESRDEEWMADHVSAVDDIFSAEQIAAAVRAAPGNAKAILSWTDRTILGAVRAAELLGIGRVPADGIARARNKYSMRRRLVEARLPGPRFALMGDARSAPLIAAHVGLPAVIKPVNGTASSFVRRVRTVDELARAWSELAERTPHALDGLFTRPAEDPDGPPLDAARQFLVESWLDGPEFVADVIVRDGVVEHVVLLETVMDDNFFEVGFALRPAGHEIGGRAALLRAIEDAIAALGIDNTTVNLDLKVDAELGATVVEVNAGRFGGQMIAPLVWEATGTDLRAEQLALMLDRPPPPRQRPALAPPLSTVSVYSAAAGKVTAVHGLDELTALPEVHSVLALVEPGDVIGEGYAIHAVNVLVKGMVEHAEVAACQRRITPFVTIDVEPVR